MTSEDVEYVKDYVLNKCAPLYIVVVTLVCLLFIAFGYSFQNAGRIDQLEKLLQDHLEQKVNSAHN